MRKILIWSGWSKYLKDTDWLIGQKERFYLGVSIGPDSGEAEVSLFINEGEENDQNNLIPLLMELHLVLWNPVFYLFWTSGMRKNTHVQYWLESSLLISTAPSNKSKKVTRKLLLVVTTTEL